MEIPFVSSGAISRAHYSLVRKLEYATSIHSANKYLATEVEAIRRQLTDTNLSLEECKQILIVLLYCHMNISNEYFPADAFHFALPQAITLAEAGRNIGQKRIGYIFCAEVMPANHELQLMLVNTLRKDLERDDIPSICLALENVIASPNEDLVPAVQSRLQYLLSHNSPYVRRRALLTFRSLATQHPALLEQIYTDILKSLKDRHPSVLNAGLALSVCAVRNNELLSDIQSIVNELLERNVSLGVHSSIPKLFSTLFVVGLSNMNIGNILEIIRSTSRIPDRAVLRGAFRLLSKIAPQALHPFISTESWSPVQNIRHFLTSHDPNDIHLFLSCLESLDPILWAGTTPDFPALLDRWEVERIMQLLDSPDNLIRRTTLKILNLVDPTIVSSYYSQAIETATLNLAVRDVEEYAVRLIEVIEIQSGSDGEVYASELMSLVTQFGQRFPNLVMEKAVTMVLQHFSDARTTFRIGFSTTMLMFLIESNSSLPQTMMIIIAALAAEQCGQLSLSPVDVIQGLASKLLSCTPSVQDACLLGMLRVAAECKEVPLAVVETVKQLGESSRQHIRRRCEQFVAFANDKVGLLEVVRKARSSSLPDFLTALLDYDNKLIADTFPETTSSTQLLSSSKLRYDAYDAPIPKQKLRARESSGSSPHTEASQLETFPDGGRSLSRIGSSLSTLDQLPRTMTPGELTLSIGRHELEIEDTSGEGPEALDDGAGSRVDLIVLDSPFVTEVVGDDDLERYWESLDKGDTRGWYRGPMDSVVRRLQRSGYTRLRVGPVDAQPYIGELKIIILATKESGGGVRGMLRLKESEEESCLWRMRSREGELCAEVRELLG